MRFHALVKLLFLISSNFKKIKTFRSYKDPRGDLGVYHGVPPWMPNWSSVGKKGTSKVPPLFDFHGVTSEKKLHRVAWKTRKTRGAYCTLIIIGTKILNCEQTVGWLQLHLYEIIESIKLFIFLLQLTMPFSGTFSCSQCRLNCQRLVWCWSNTLAQQILHNT